MSFLNYTRVRLLSNKYNSEGVDSGDIGYIIEIYNKDAYEVEFSNHNGITVALIVVHPDEIEVAEPITL